MNYLLDTNVVSEWTKPQPDPNVMAWLAEVDEDRVFLSVATFAEVRHGIELMPPGRRRDRLAAWLADELPDRFENRILGIDKRIAEAWGMIMARARAAGVAMGTMDGFFAATAETYDMRLVTRNMRDFRRVGIPLLDPWKPRS